MTKPRIVVVGGVTVLAGTVLAAAALVLWGVPFASPFPDVEQTPDDDLFTSGYFLEAPDKSKAAAVYVLESPMAFGSPRSFLRIVPDLASFRPTRSAWSCPEGGISWVSWRGPDALDVVCATTAGPSPSQRSPQATASVDLEGVTLRMRQYRITAGGRPDRGRLDSIRVHGDVVALKGDLLASGETIHITARRDEINLVLGETLYVAIAQLDTVGTLANGVPFIGYSTFVFTPARGLDTMQLLELPTRRILR